MKFSTLNFENNPNIGLFAMATDRFCLLDHRARKKDARLARKTLKVDVVEATALRTGFMGMFVAGNSKGVIVSNGLHEDEIERMRKRMDVLVLDTRHTALGNLILANDKGCMISKALEAHGAEIADFLGVETRMGTIAGLDLVGSLAVANAKGCLVHGSATTAEAKALEKTLGVPVVKGSVNFGSHWIRSGLVANSSGFVAGDRTSGPELGLIAEALGFV